MVFVSLGFVSGSCISGGRQGERFFPSGITMSDASVPFAANTNLFARK